MRLNELQLQAIKDKAGYKSSDYCIVGAEEVKQFLLEQGIKLGNKKKKETLLKLICANEELTHLFGEAFFDKFYCNIYDLLKAYPHLQWDEAQALIQAELVETTGKLNKSKYPLLSLNALKFTQEEIREIYESNFSGGVIKIRLEVDSKEQGANIVDQLEQLFDISDLKYQDRRIGSGLHLYTTMFPKGAISEAYSEAENTRLKQELAESQLQLMKVNEQLTKALDVINNHEWSIEETEKYKFLQESYNKVITEMVDLRMEYKSALLEIEGLKQSSKGRPDIGEEKENKITSLRREGYSMRKIATQVGVSEGTVVNVLRKHGLID